MRRKGRSTRETTRHGMLGKLFEHSDVSVTSYRFVSIDKHIFLFRVPEGTVIIFVEPMLRSTMNIDRANYHNIMQVETEMTDKCFFGRIAEAVDTHWTCGRAM
jgi:hypothetical protein